MAHYIVIALHELENPQDVAAGISELLAAGGVTREVLNLDVPSPLLDAVKQAFQPAWDDEQGEPT